MNTVAEAAPLAPFGAPLAGWWQRVGALLLDVVILGIGYAILIGIFDAATDRSGGGQAAALLIFLVGQAVYFGILNGTGSGQTPGNRAPGIAVRDINTGEPIGFGRGLLRWFVRFLLYVVVIPGIVNDLLPLWSSRRQTIADKAANSVMIRL